MISNKQFPILLAIVALIPLFGHCQSESKDQNVGQIEMVTSENKDAVVQAECVKTSAGKTVGFRIEIINPNSDKNIVLAMNDDCRYHFIVNVLNEHGINISPWQKKIPANQANRFKLCTIPSKNSHVWFIPIPNQVLIDVLKPNDKNLQPISNGKYIAKIKISLGYFIQDKKENLFPKYPDYKNLELTLMHMPIEIDYKLLNQDINKIYQAMKKSKN